MSEDRLEEIKEERQCECTDDWFCDYCHGKALADAYGSPGGD